MYTTSSITWPYTLYYLSHTPHPLSLHLFALTTLFIPPSVGSSNNHSYLGPPWLQLQPPSLHHFAPATPFIFPPFWLQQQSLYLHHLAAIMPYTLNHSLLPLGFNHTFFQLISPLFFRQPPSNMPSLHSNPTPTPGQHSPTSTSPLYTFHSHHNTFSLLLHSPYHTPSTTPPLNPSTLHSCTL